MLRRLLSLTFVTLGLTASMASVAAQPFTQGAAASAISAANALSARIRSYHRWQGLTPPPASYCATMREGEAVLKQLSRLASRAILYRAPGLALSLQQAGDRLSDELDEEEETNQQAGMPYTLYPCPVSAPYPPRALVLRIGYTPFFICLGLLDVIGAVILWTVVKADVKSDVKGKTVQHRGHKAAAKVKTDTKDGKDASKS